MNYLINFLYSSLNNIFRVVKDNIITHAIMDEKQAASSPSEQTQFTQANQNQPNELRIKLKEIMVKNPDHAVKMYNIYANIGVNLSDKEVKVFKPSNVKDLFAKFIKCDAKKFQCDNIVNKLMDYYDKSVPEVKDIYNVASKMHWLSGCGIEVAYKQGGDVAYYTISTCKIKMEALTKVDTEFFALLTHEMKHWLNYVVYLNLTNPYKDSNENHDTYEETIMQPTVKKASSMHYVLKDGFERIIKNYPSEYHHMELDVRLYEWLVYSNKKHNSDVHHTPFSEKDVRDALSYISHDKFMQDVCSELNICE